MRVFDKRPFLFFSFGGTLISMPFADVDFVIYSERWFKSFVKVVF